MPHAGERRTCRGQLAHVLDDDVRLSIVNQYAQMLVTVAVNDPSQYLRVERSPVRDDDVGPVRSPQGPTRRTLNLTTPGRTVVRPGLPMS